MRTSFILGSLAALAASIMAGNLSYADAANCETGLKPLYKCTADFDNGGSVDYCVAVDSGPREDGEFVMVADQTYYALCTCNATGNPPNVNFGVSRDFVCAEDATHTTSIGRTTGNKIKGQTFNTSVGIRSVFACQAVVTCP
jgi:hypothetical protein